MADERFTFSAEGPLAAAIRAAADAAGVPPAAWVARALATELGLAEGAGPSSGPSPDRTSAHRPPGAASSRGASPDQLQHQGAWQTMVDEAGLFTVALPGGWANRAWCEAGPSSRAQLVTSTSPDQTVTLRSGDATLPTFIEPMAALFSMQPGAVARGKTSAEQFGTQWLGQAFGSRPGFRVLGYQDSPDLTQAVYLMVQRAGGQASWNSAGLVEFEYDDGPGASKVSGVLAVATTGIGFLWIPQVHVVTKRGGSARQWIPVLLTMVGSLAPTSAAQAGQAQARAATDAQHQATMANLQANTQAMTAAHNQRMQDIQTSGMAHQARMADMQQTWDMQNDAWRAQQQSQSAQHSQFMNTMRQGPVGAPGMGGQDVQHDQFLNMIREEHTVVDGQGYEHQVAEGADRYYYNQHTEQWIGLQEHHDIADYTERPDDWQEGTITR